MWEVFGKVRPDHTSRYYWSKIFMRENDKVLDAMCGVGYGSFIIASQVGCPISIEAFDCDKETIDYANEWYKLPQINFQCFTYDLMPYAPKSFDKIICFEGIEHITNPPLLLRMFHKMLKDDGLLLLSTPNGNKLKFDKVRFPEHYFHYTPDGLEADLNQAGFKVRKWLSQPDKYTLRMDNNLEGIFMLCEAVKL